jgi:prevent-host-death family protein
MRVIQASEAKAKFLSLLDDVEKGETLVITRHGKPIARIVPDEDEARRQRIEAFAKLREIGKSIKARGGTLEEFIAGKHEGHKY